MNKRDLLLVPLAGYTAFELGSEVGDLYYRNHQLEDAKDQLNCIENMPKNEADKPIPITPICRDVLFDEFHPRSTDISSSFVVRDGAIVIQDSQYHGFSASPGAILIESRNNLRVVQAERNTFDNLVGAGAVGMLAAISLTVWGVKRRRREAKLLPPLPSRMSAAEAEPSQKPRKVSRRILEYLGLIDKPDNQLAN